MGITVIPNQVLLSKNGEYKGYFIDLFRLIESELGVKFKFVYFKTWSDLLKAAKNKKVDIVFAAQQTPERLKYFNFTDTVLIQKNFVFTNTKNKIHSLMDLYGKKVAVSKCSALEEFLKINYPQIKLVPVSNELEALKLVNENKVFGAVLEAVRSGYYIKKYNLKNISVGPELDYDYYLRIAVIKTKPELSVILNKAINNLPKKELEYLKIKWGYYYDKVYFLNKKRLFFIIGVFLVLGLIILYVYDLNNKLKKEIKQKEEALKRIKLLRDSKLTQMSEILKMIAHQWKQPLNNISLSVQILQMKYNYDDLKKEEFNELIKKIISQIDEMSKTINDFQELFRNNELTKYKLNEEIKKIVLKLKPFYENVEIFLELPEEEIVLKTYSQLLNEVIVNILNNAKDVLKERKIKNPKIYVIVTNENNQIKIVIKDNGGGIETKIIDKIFDPYFSTKKDKNGTGLGLYMAKLIVEEYLKGSINVKNTKYGAQFEIILPYK